MDCKMTEERLISYSLNEMTDKDKRQFEAHLKECASCSIQFEELTMLQDAWNYPTFHVEESFADRVMEQIPNPNILSSKTNRIKNHFRSFAHFAIATAATFLLLYSGVFGEFVQVSEQLSTIFTDTTFNIQVATGEGMYWLHSLSLQALPIIK